MDLATATPVEIDTELGKIYTKVNALGVAQAQAAQYIDRIDNVKPGSYNSMLPEYSPKKRAELAKKVDRLGAEILRLLSEEAGPLKGEFARRGGWTRYYLVDNTNGHVHSSTSCTTCFSTTEYAWLVEHSGWTPEALVEEAGEQACTICFPWAPVDTLRRKSRLESPARKEARLERERKAAEKAAKAAATAITDVDGSPLRDEPPGAPYRGSIIKTIRTAWIELTNEVWYKKAWGDSNGRHEAKIQHIGKALAVRLNRPIEDVIAEAEKKAAKRK